MLLPYVSHITCRFQVGGCGVDSITLKCLIIFLQFTWHCPMESRQSCIIFSFRKTEKSSSSHESTRKQSFPWRTLRADFSVRLICQTSQMTDPGAGETRPRIAMIVLPYQDPLTLGGHIGTSKNQEESENRYWLSNLQHLQQTPSSFQSNIRLSLLYPLNIPKMHLIYHYPYFNLNCYHLCSGSERQTLHCFSAV